MRLRVEARAEKFWFPEEITKNQREKQPRRRASSEEVVTGSHACFPARGKINQTKLIKHVCQKWKVTETPLTVPQVLNGVPCVVMKTVLFHSNCSSTLHVSSLSGVKWQNAKGMKCFSAIASLSLVTFPSNKCVGGTVLFCFSFDFIVEGAKGQLRNFCAPFWDVGICSYRGKKKGTYKGPAEKAFSDVLLRGLVTMSFHSHICSLFDLDLHVFWWNVFKALYFFDPPCIWWFHFHRGSQRNPAVWSSASLQHFCKDGSSSFPGYEIKGRKSLRVFQGWEMSSSLAHSKYFLRKISEPSCLVLFLTSVWLEGPLVHRHKQRRGKDCLRRLNFWWLWNNPLHCSQSHLLMHYFMIGVSSSQSIREQKWLLKWKRDLLLPLSAACYIWVIAPIALSDFWSNKWFSNLSGFQDPHISVPSYFFSSHKTFARGSVSVEYWCSVR